MLKIICTFQVLELEMQFEQRFSGRFRFEGAVISLPKDSFSMRDVYQLYAKHHAEFTADEYIYFQRIRYCNLFRRLSEVSVRVSHDLFVSKTDKKILMWIQSISY